MPADAAVDAWLQFVTCAALIAIAGTRLSRYGDVIADKTGVSGAWIGLVLLATVTSLPELVTGVSAVTVAAVPDIAVGDVMGSCVFNLAILVIVELLAGGDSIYRRASQGQILAATFGIVLIGFAGVNIVLGGHGLAFSIGHIGASTPIIVAIYVLAVRAVFVYERSGIAAYSRSRPTTTRSSRWRTRSCATRLPPWSSWPPASGFPSPPSTVRTRWTGRRPSSERCSSRARRPFRN